MKKGLKIAVIAGLTVAVGLVATNTAMGVGVYKQIQIQLAELERKYINADEADRAELQAVIAENVARLEKSMQEADADLGETIEATKAAMEKADATLVKVDEAQAKQIRDAIIEATEEFAALKAADAELAAAGAKDEADLAAKYETVMARIQAAEKDLTTIEAKEHEDIKALQAAIDAVKANYETILAAAATAETLRNGLDVLDAKLANCTTKAEIADIRVALEEGYTKAVEALGKAVDEKDAALATRLDNLAKDLGALGEKVTVVYTMWSEFNGEEATIAKLDATGILTQAHIDEGHELVKLYEVAVEAYKDIKFEDVKFKDIKLVDAIKEANRIHYEDNYVAVEKYQSSIALAADKEAATLQGQEGEAVIYNNIAELRLFIYKQVAYNLVKANKGVTYHFGEKEADAFNAVIDAIEPDAKKMEGMTIIELANYYRGLNGEVDAATEWIKYFATLCETTKGYTDAIPTQLAKAPEVVEDATAWIDTYLDVDEYIAEMKKESATDEATCKLAYTEEMAEMDWASKALDLYEALVEKRITLMAGVTAKADLIGKVATADITAQHNDITNFAFFTKEIDDAGASQASTSAASTTRLAAQDILDWKFQEYCRIMTNKNTVAEIVELSALTKDEKTFVLADLNVIVDYPDFMLDCTNADKAGVTTEADKRILGCDHHKWVTVNLTAARVSDRDVDDAAINELANLTEPQKKAFTDAVDTLYVYKTVFDGTSEAKKEKDVTDYIAESCNTVAEKYKYAATASDTVMKLCADADTATGATTATTDEEKTYTKAVTDLVRTANVLIDEEGKAMLVEHADADANVAAASAGATTATNCINTLDAAHKQKTALDATIEGYIATTKKTYTDNHADDPYDIVNNTKFLGFFDIVRNTYSFDVTLPTIGEDATAAEAVADMTTFISTIKTEQNNMTARDAAAVVECGAIGGVMTAEYNLRKAIDDYKATVADLASDAKAYFEAVADAVLAHYTYTDDATWSDAAKILADSTAYAADIAKVKAASDLLAGDVKADKELGEYINAIVTVAKQQFLEFYENSRKDGQKTLDEKESVDALAALRTAYEFEYTCPTTAGKAYDTILTELDAFADTLTTAKNKLAARKNTEVAAELEIAKQAMIASYTIKETEWFGLVKADLFGADGTGTVSGKAKEFEDTILAKYGDYLDTYTKAVYSTLLKGLDDCVKSTDLEMVYNTIVNTLEESMLATEPLYGLKQLAIAQLNDYGAGHIDQVNQAWVNKAWTKGVEDVTNATDASDIDAKLVAAKAAIDTAVAEATAFQRNLAEAKAEVTLYAGSVKNAHNESHVDEALQAELLKIGAATTQVELDAAIVAAKAAIDEANNAALVEYKTAAKTTLYMFVEQKVVDLTDYDQLLSGAYAEGCSAIDACSTYGDVDSELNAQKSVAIPTICESILMTLRGDAQTKYECYIESYTFLTTAEIKGIIDAINVTSTKAGIDKIVADGQEYADGQKKKFDAAKASAIQDIDVYAAVLTNTDNAQDVANAAASAKDALRNCTTFAQIEDAKAAARTAIEEAAVKALNDAKNGAAAELLDYAVSKLTEPNRDAVNAAYYKGLDAIAVATTVENVFNALNIAKGDIDNAATSV